MREKSEAEGRRRLLLNGNGPNEQSPLHSAILQLRCALFLVLSSADNAFGKRKRKRKRGRTLNKLCTIAAAETRRANTDADDICRKYASLSSTRERKREEGDGESAAVMGARSDPQKGEEGERCGSVR